MTDPIMQTIKEGDTVRLRNGHERTVEFIAHMPHDLHDGYDYVIRLSGYEADTYSEDGDWIAEEDESILDIIEVIVKVKPNEKKKCFQFWL